MSLAIGLGLALAPPARAVCVIKSGAVLRASPEASAPPTWRVSKFMPLQPTGQKKGSWIEVADVDGQRHWVASSEISSRLRCLVVKTHRTRLRVGPGAKFGPAPAGIADRYTPFVDLGGEEGWTRVEDEMGQRSWINLDQTWKANRRMHVSFESKQSR